MDRHRWHGRFVGQSRPTPGLWSSASEALHVSESARSLLKCKAPHPEFLSQQIWGTARSSAFLSSSYMILGSRSSWCWFKNIALRSNGLALGYWILVCVHVHVRACMYVHLCMCVCLGRVLFSSISGLSLTGCQQPLSPSSSPVPTDV